MIPVFPKFKKISRKDRDEILNYTKKFLPYSDYNFNSLWAWDTTGEMRFTVLNENLVVTMPDYITGKPILSFIGNKKIKETTLELLEYAKKKNIEGGLTLIPEVTAEKLVNNGILITKDRQHYDYIFSTKKLAELKGKSYKSKRLLANKFIANYPDAEFRTSPLSDSKTHTKILTLLSEWETQKELTSDNKLENTAIKRLLKLAKLNKNELIVSGIYLNGDLVAFSIDEVLTNGYALSHFLKVNYAYRGASEYLNQRTAQFLNDDGVELWNWEQDLGIEGLKYSKIGYRPMNFLKKYKITKKQ